MKSESNQENKKGYIGRGMDGFIARSYDRNAKNHIMPQYKLWAEYLVNLIPKDSEVLELAAGPGYLSIELAKSGIRKITGLDISETFVEIARKNALESGVVIEFIRGNASELPFPEGKFTHIVCTSAFKNFSDPLKALLEIHRVLKPRGKIWISDMRGDVPNEIISNYVKTEMRLKGMNGFITNLIFKNMLRKRAYTRELMMKLISATPFKIISFEQTKMENLVLMEK